MIKILIDIGHPAHVHLFRPFAAEMQANGHQILFSCRQKEFEIELLTAAGFNFVCLGKHRKSKLGKIWGLFYFNIQLVIISSKFKPDVFLSHGSIYAAQVSWLLGKPHIALEDTGNAEQVRLYLPFSDCVLTSLAFHKKLGKKQIYYDSFHEISYLHQNYYSPDKNIFKYLNIDEDEEYCIIRLVAWNATHDSGNSGLCLPIKKELLSYLSLIMKVFISSEEDLPPEFEKYKIKIPPEKMHDALAFANLFIGEGATMAAESAILGTPAILINSVEAGHISELEGKKLLFHFRNGQGLQQKIEELLMNPNLKEEWRNKAQDLRKAKIDLTAFLVWFVENYPNSLKIMKENPDYQYRFK